MKKTLLLVLLIGICGEAQAMDWHNSHHDEMLHHRSNMIMLLDAAFLAVALVQVEIFNGSKEISSVTSRTENLFQSRLSMLGRCISALEESRNLTGASDQATGLGVAFDALRTWKDNMYRELLDARRNASEGGTREFTTRPFLFEGWELLPAQIVSFRPLSEAEINEICEQGAENAIARADALGCTEGRGWCSIM
jgi:hypothetical protein